MRKKNSTVFIFFFSFLITSCRESANPCSLSKEVLNNIQSLDSLVNLPELRQRDKDWMENSHKEPFIPDSKIETYRFIWSSSFDTTKVYRIEKNNGHYDLTTKIFTSHQDTIGTTNKFNITENEWDNIVNGLARNNFWTYTTHDNRDGLDGSSWLLEGYKPVKDRCTRMNYHRVNRWSPIDSTFILMCKLISKVRE